MGTIWNAYGCRARRWPRTPVFLLSICALAPSLLLGRTSAQNLTACSASFRGSELTISNHWIERRWSVASGQLRATSIRDLKMKVEWLAAGAPAVTPGEHPEFVFSQHWQSSPV